jgi:cephalosporin hydroxylase
MSDPVTHFTAECQARAAAYPANAPLAAAARAFLDASVDAKYSYNFTWLGRPIIQYPQDVVATQEIIWRCRPDLIIETGVAHGGSLIFSASMLALLDLCDALEHGTTFDPRAGRRRVVGIDVDIRAHNRARIEGHPLAGRIDLIEGSSVAPDVVAAVAALARQAGRVLVCLDSDHTHDHVLSELEAYAPLVTPGSYCIVFDTFIEDRPAGSYPDRSWDKGRNPKTAVREYLARHPEFTIDRSVDDKLLISVAPEGFLLRSPSV